jgi:hypothetical protein
MTAREVIAFNAVLVALAIAVSVALHRPEKVIVPAFVRPQCVEPAPPTAHKLRWDI